MQYELIEEENMAELKKEVDKTLNVLKFTLNDQVHN